jgi:hypothetical protein
MFNGRVIWEKISSADEPTNAPIAALNDNAPSGTGSNTANALPESQPEPESTSPPNLPSPELARTFLTTLWNGGIKNSGSKSNGTASLDICFMALEQLTGPQNNNICSCSYQFQVCLALWQK